MTVFDADRAADPDAVGNMEAGEEYAPGLLPEQPDTDLVDLRDADDRVVLGKDDDYEWAVS